MSKRKYFLDIVKIRKEDADRMYAQELVLRFFTLKNFGTTFDKNIQKHMDDYMLKVSKGEIIFKYKEEERIFEETCKILQNLQKNVFKLSTLNFSTSMYDALMINVALNLKQCSQYSTKEFYDKIEKLKKDSTFRKNTNSASSSKYRINSKIEIAHKALID